MLTSEQLKQLRQKVDLSDLWDEIAQLPDDTTRRTVQKMVDRMQEGLIDILTVLMEEAEEKEALIGKEYVIKFVREHEHDTGFENQVKL